MSLHAFTLPFESLPRTLPVFPLANAVVMPGSQLPLNIFEPRYLNMVFDALGAERMIGMLQPESETSTNRSQPLYRVGTAGRITLFQETEDGRLLIMLTGISRFAVEEEISTTRGYRRMVVDWSPFRIDYHQLVWDSPQRGELLRSLRDYFSVRRLETDWDLLDRVDTLELLNRLVAGLPIGLAERQMLIETITPQDRLQRLMALLRYESAPLASDGPH